MEGPLTCYWIASSGSINWLFLTFPIPHVPWPGRGRGLKLLIQGVWRNISASNSRVSLLHLSLQFVSQWPYLWLCYSISKPWLCHFSQVHLSVTFSSCGIHNQEEKVTTWLVTLTLVWQYDVVLHWLVYKSNIKEKWCWRHWGVLKAKVWKQRTDKKKGN